MRRNNFGTGDSEHYELLAQDGMGSGTQLYTTHWPALSASTTTQRNNVLNWTSTNIPTFACAIYPHLPANLILTAEIKDAIGADILATLPAGWSATEKTLVTGVWDAFILHKVNDLLLLSLRFAGDCAGCGVDTSTTWRRRYQFSQDDYAENFTVVNGVFYRNQFNQPVWWQGNYSGGIDMRFPYIVSGFRLEGGKMGGVDDATFSVIDLATGQLLMSSHIGPGDNQTAFEWSWPAGEYSESGVKVTVSASGSDPDEWVYLNCLSFDGYDTTPPSGTADAWC